MKDAISRLRAEVAHVSASAIIKVVGETHRARRLSASTQWRTWVGGELVRIQVLVTREPRGEP